ncbi:MAG: ATP-binding cassette domain-containing protein [Flavobacteriales bacterium]
MQHLLIAEGLHKQYGAKKALSGLDLKIAYGSIYGLLGPNGAGKTTFIRLINQIQLPDAGKIIFDGESLSPKHITQIGYLPEERGLYKNMYVEEQILYLAQLKGMKKDHAKAMLQWWFDRLEIGSWRHKKLRTLSKGMAQKIQFIITVLHAPKLMIFDEPFSGFDPINTQLIRDQILELKKNGSTIILSTHRMASVEAICDYIALIDRSQKILDGPLPLIKEQFKENRYQVRLEIRNQLLWERLLVCYPLSKVIREGDFCSFEIQLQESSMHLLQELMQIGEIHLFGKYTPSLDEIFINAVKKVKCNAKNMVDHPT